MICSTNIRVGSGTWKESAECSSICLDIVIATSSLIPYASCKKDLESSSRRIADTISVKSSRALDSSLDLDLASPDHEGTVGPISGYRSNIDSSTPNICHSVGGTTQKNYISLLKFATKDEDSCPRIDPSALNTR